VSTPATKNINTFLTLGLFSKQAVFFPTQNPDGTPLDVSSGFTSTMRSRPSIQDNTLAAALTDLGSGSVAKTYSPTGVTYTFPWSDITTAPPTLSQNYEVVISNDSNATLSTIASGQITLVLDQF
jgi:hypothetical protein